VSLPRYASYKDSDVEWLKEVPAHWGVRRLGYFFDERREKVGDTDFPALSVTKVGVLPQLETAAKTDDNDNRKKICIGDFVINGRSDRKGSAGVATLDGSCSLINIVLCPHEEIEPQFAHHLLRSVPFQEEFYRFGKGIVADLWSTNYSEMKNIVLAVPANGEQAQIATFLDLETTKIDALVAEQEKLIVLLKEKRQALISHAVTKGLNPDAPMKDSGIEWLGQVPAHWDGGGLTRFIGPVVDYRGRTPEKVDDGIFLVAAKNIRNGRIDYEVSQEYVNPASAQSLLDRGRSEVGDLLFTMEAPLGQVALIDRTDIALAQRIVKFRGEGMFS
jgi:type I restriction enzyme S subunit